MSFDNKPNLHEQLRVGLSEFSKTTMKLQQIYSNFQVSTPREIKAFPPFFLVRKFSINRSQTSAETIR